MCKNIVVHILLVSGLLSLLLAPPMFAAETQYPQGVAAAKESTVQVTAWIDGTVSGGAGWSIDARSSGPWSFDARGPWMLGSGFFANEDGDVFTAAHVVDLADEELVDGAIMYFLGGIWFEDKWYEELNFETFYNYLYWWAWELWLDDELTITAEEADYVHRLGDEEPHMVEDIRFREDPDTGMDIAILATGLTDTPYIGLKKAAPPEGSQAYVIGYASIDLMVEFWQAMDDIMEDPRERPDTFDELMRKAEERMLECLRKEGPSVEVGLLGSSTRMYNMDARRFHGTTWGGFSGGPIVDELGNCLGLLPWGAGDSRGYFIPSEHLNDASRGVGINTYPALEIGSVEIEPSFIEAGQSFKVTAEVSNLGFVRGDYTATLKLSDGTTSSQGLTVEVGQSETLTLSAVKASAGFSTGSLEIGDTSIDFMVNPLEISSLQIEPSFIEGGQIFQVTAEVSNFTSVRGDYTATLKLSDGTTSSQGLTVAAGESETLALFAVKASAGFSTGSLEIGDTSIDLIVNPVELSNLTIEPTAAAPGEVTRVQVEARNVAEQQVTSVISLNIEGEEEATETLTLESGAIETVEFQVTRDTPDTYEVIIGNLKQSFTVQPAFPLTAIILIIIGSLGVAGIAVGTLALRRSRRQSGE